MSTEANLLQPVGAAVVSPGAGVMTASCDAQANDSGPLPRLEDRIRHCAEGQVSGSSAEVFRHHHASLPILGYLRERADPAVPDVHA